MRPDCGCEFRADRCRSWRRRREAADRSAGRGGKSGGFRTIILFRVGERAFFVHGFAKNEQDNIRGDELTAFKQFASAMTAYDDVALATVIANGTLTEVMCND